MEIIIGFIVLMAISLAIRLALSLVASGVRAAARTAVGKGSFSDNMELAFEGMRQLEIRFNDKQAGETGSRFLVKEIEGKGLFPLNHTTRVAFVTSVLDTTSGEPQPVISAIEDLQEPANVIYQHTVEVGQVSSDQGFPDWVRLGVILPNTLQPPFGGQRKLVAVLRMVDLDNPPAIIHGHSAPDQSGLLWMNALEFNYTFDEKGYQEAAEHRSEALALAVKIGVGVAMADGSLHDREGEILRTQIARAIEPFTGQMRERLRNLYNNAMREAYGEVRGGNFSLRSLTERLNEIGDKTTKYEAVEFCFDVMASDGGADPGELKVVRGVAEALGLDLDEIERMRDQKIIGLDTTVSTQTSVEDLLGIEVDWSRQRIRNHLRTEFQKWTNRLTVLSEGTERDNAQRMLDLITEARKKYD